MTLAHGTIAAMNAQASQLILATRLGKTVHVSVLRYRVEALLQQFPCSGCNCIEDWLVIVANARGAKVVTPPSEPPVGYTPPGKSIFTNEALVVAICQLNNLDRPQMLRLAAQLISMSAVDIPALVLEAQRERVEPVLAELSRQALKVDPDHPAWRAIHTAFSDESMLREPLLHWTRLAEPVMKNGMYNAESWRLVA